MRKQELSRHKGCFYYGVRDCGGGKATVFIEAEGKNLLCASLFGASSG